MQIHFEWVEVALVGFYTGKKNVKYIIDFPALVSDSPMMMLFMVYKCFHWQYIFMEWIGNEKLIPENIVCPFQEDGSCTCMVA